MKKSSLIILFAFVLTAATFFRFFDLTNIPPGLYQDEAMNGNNALEVLDTGKWKVFFTDNNGREGLFINLLSLSIRIFGHSSLSIRILPALFGIGTVIALFLLSRALFINSKHRDFIALASSWFLAVGFWHVNFSRIGFRAIMAPFFLLWSFYLLMLLLNKKWERNTSIIIASLSGLLFGLGFYSYISYRIAPLLLILPFIYLYKKYFRAGESKYFISVLSFFIIFSIISSLPLAFYFIENPGDFFGRTSQISIFTEPNPLYLFAENSVKTAGMLFWMGDWNWRHNLPGSPQLWWPVAVFFALGIIAGFKSIKRKDENSFGFKFTFLWMILMLLPVAISYEELLFPPGAVTIPHALRSIIAIPPIMILAAAGLASVYGYFTSMLEKKKNEEKISEIKSVRLKKELNVLVLIILLAIAVNTFNNYFQKWSIKPEVAEHFDKRYYNLGIDLNSFSADINKYVIVNTRVFNLVRGVPAQAQSVMYATDTFSEEKRNANNIKYLMRFEINKIECENGCIISMLNNDVELKKTLKEKHPDLKLIKVGNSLFYKKK